MRVKVIINDGVVTEVLADEPVDLEVVDIDSEYSEDYEKLQEYEEDLHKDESLKKVDFTFANFEEEGSE